MNWQNVKLVWQREIRDQLRDRRTLFVICILPLMIYPMLGMTFSRMTQFISQHDATVTVIGYEQLADLTEFPQFIVDGQFNPELFGDNKAAQRMKLVELKEGGNVLQEARTQLENGSTDLIVHFPPGFAERLKQLREATLRADRTAPTTSLARPPNPTLYINTEDASQLANTRVNGMLAKWQSEIVHNNLMAGRLPLDVTHPFDVTVQNIAPQATQEASFWAKLLPFIVFICALTGAFYPAVDLCAGEKERGTLETLLTSPAARNEIVGGKLLTVITFSIGSALCNLASMAITSQLVIEQLNALTPPGQPALSAPSLVSIGWLLVALVPMSIVFSAASLALASLAGSTKEGQYYLMPLFMVCMPLMLLPMMPGVELTFATSMVPISGMVLLMQAAMEGKLMLATTYVVPVGLVMFGCCALSIRWAIDQFNQESVLFRDAENFDLVTWIRYAYRHRPATPNLGAAAAAISLIFLAQFGVQSLGIVPTSKSLFIGSILISLLGAVLLPVVLVAVSSVRSLKQSFLLNDLLTGRHLVNVVIALSVAVLIQPFWTLVFEWLQLIAPIPPDLIDSIQQFEKIAAEWDLSLPTWLLLTALLPGICEELAFRGFILGGLKSRLPAFWAVFLTSLVFGLAHVNTLQQTISAGLLGLILGYVAVKSKQITPCIVLHMSYNGLLLLRTEYANTLQSLPHADWVIRETSSPGMGIGFTTPLVVICSLAAVALLWQVGPHHRRSAGTLGLQESASSPLPSTAPAENTGA